MIQCERGHFFDENRFTGCPYCNQITNQQRSVIPPIAPAMDIPKPSCGKTVAIEGMDTAPSVGKTVAIENYEETVSHVNKTVAISEDVNVSSGLPLASAAVPSFPAASAPVPAPSEPVTVPAAPAVPENPDAAAAIPFNGVAEELPKPVTEQFDPDSLMKPYQVTGLGVKENPAPIPVSEPTYDRPYAVSGLAVKENPVPTSAESGASFPVSQQDGAPLSAEASAMAAMAFPGGPNPFMVPGMMPGMAPAMPGAASLMPPMPNAAQDSVQNEKSEESSPVEEIGSAPSVVEDPAPVSQEIPAPVEEIVSESVPVVEEIATPAVEETFAPVVEEAPAPIAEEAPAPVSEPIQEPAPAPMPFIMPAPSDPNATVAMTESDMDYLPRIHARAFLVCIDGPMTGASFVFQENKAIIGRQKNYEIALFRDPSVSRSPHAIIKYDKNTLKYTVAPGDAEKLVSVNGAFISQEQELGIYDILGIGQSRLLFIPVCSEKFAW